MKILNKQGLQQIRINHSSDSDNEDFINLYKKCSAKPYSFLVIDTTLSLDNPLRFQKKSFRINMKTSWKLMIRLEKENWNTLTENLQTEK